MQKYTIKRILGQLGGNNLRKLANKGPNCPNAETCLSQNKHGHRTQAFSDYSLLAKDNKDYDAQNRFL